MSNARHVILPPLAGVKLYSTLMSLSFRAELNEKGGGLRRILVGLLVG